MGSPGISLVLQHLYRLAAGQANVSVPDRLLLERFVAWRDDQAFTALVHRHGPMVLGVCRRLLGKTHDMEDCFQAIFLVFARKAPSIRKGVAVGSWLHGVALRVAYQARREAGRRARRDQQQRLAATSDASDALTWSEFRSVLDEELSQLPASWRAPLILCYLEGQTQDEAAHRLGWSKSTLRRRLERGRGLLQTRLERRGVTLSAGLVATLFSETAALAAVSKTVTAGTVKTALLFGAGKLSGAAITARPVVLAESVLQTMALGKITWMAVIMLSLSLVTGAGLGVFHAVAGKAADGQVAPAAQAQAEPVKKANDPKPAGVALKPISWKEKTVLKTPGWLSGSVAYAPDGKTLVAGGTWGGIGDTGRVIAYDTAGFKEKWKADVGGNFAAVAFSADGKSVLATVKDGVTLLDADTGRPIASVEEKDSSPIAVGAFPDREIAVDGQKIIFHKIIFGNARGYFVKDWLEQGSPGTIKLSTIADGKKPADSNAVPLAIDPAGRSVIAAGPIDRDTGNNILWAWVAGDYGKDSPGNRFLKGHEASVVSAAWSRDGEVAVTGDASGRVIVWDAVRMDPFAFTEIKFGDRVAALAISTDCKYTAAVTVGKQANVYVWKTFRPRKDMKPIHKNSSSDFNGPIRATLAFSPDGRQLTGTVVNTAWLLRLGTLIGKLHVWEIESWPPQPLSAPLPASKLDWTEGKPIVDPRFDIRSVAVSPDLKRFAAESGEKTIVFETATSTKLYEVNGRFPCFVGGDLVTWVNSAVQYDAASGKEKKTFPPALSGNKLMRAQISPDGKTIAGFDGTNVRLIDIATGADAIHLAGQAAPKDVVANTFPCNEVVWSPDGKRIAGVYRANEAGGDGGLAIWDAATGKQLTRLEKTAEDSGLLMSFAFSPSGKTLVVAGRRHDRGDKLGGGVVIELLEATTLKPLRNTNINSRDGGADATAVAFSPDGRTVAIAVNLHTGKGPHVRVFLWNSDTGNHDKQLMTHRHADLISALAFTPDGTKLITATGSVVTPNGKRLSHPAFRQKEQIIHGILIWHGEPEE